MRKNVTMKQIADIAGVSRGTVDKVLNERPGVSNIVRIKVQKIALECGYKPNYIAKALALKKTINIGVINAGSENPYYSRIKEGIYSGIDNYRDFGITVVYREMKNINAEEQLAILDELETLELSALVLIPIIDMRIGDKLNLFAERNIKIITLSSDIPNVDKLCFIGQDTFKAGRIAGDLMAKILTGKGQVAIITGNSLIHAQNLRINGFKEYIKQNFSDIEIVDIKESFEDNNLSYKHTLELIQKYEDLKGIFIIAGGIGGVGAAIEETSKQGLIKVVCFDNFKETIELIKRGVIDFTIAQDTQLKAYTAIQVICNVVLKKEKLESDFISAKIDILTKENIY